MVVMDVTREVLTAAPAPNAEGTAAPINQLAKMPHYVSPYFTNVRADQPGLAIDHRPGRSWQGADGPLGSGYKGQLLRLSVMNMWTNVFASIGMRTTGTGPGNFLIAGPDWTGASPADVKQTYRSSTRYAWILGQTQANGPDDFAVVNALQAEYKLTPLSAWGNPYTPPADTPVK
jgi:hypothetical protein